MRVPTSPPRLGELTDSISEVLERGLYGAIGPLDPERRYLHWDEMRHRTPPAGFTLEQWWSLTKLARNASLKSIPLADVGGVPFRFCAVDPVAAMLHQIDREAAGSIRMDEELGAPHLRDRYIVTSLMEEAITSSQLEGASTTRRAAKTMLRSGRRPTTSHERMIFNNYRAMEWLRERTREPLTLELLLELHRCMTDVTLTNEHDAGRLRRADEPTFVTDEHGNVLHTPPPAGSLAERIETMCAFANDRSDDGPFIHPVVRAALLHFWLAYDHPFVNGNGRTARALFYWSVLRDDYWLFEFVSISRIIKRAPAKYGRAFLFAETDENDATYFVLHQLETMVSAIENLRQYIAKSLRERQVSDALLRNCDLNHRQRALLQHALKHPAQDYTVRSHQTSHRVAYQTARTDMLGLEDLGLLDGRKVGRARVWRPTPELVVQIERRFG